MNQTCNQPCLCGSGLRHKRCCGILPNEIVSVLKTNSSISKFTLERLDKQGKASYFERNIIDLLSRGNLPQAEIILRLSLENDPNNPKIYNFLGQIAIVLNLYQLAIHYFNEAIRLAPDWQMPHLHLENVNKSLNKDQVIPTNRGLETKNEGKAERFLLIKAWGYGFWSDVSHLLGQFLIAEITGRIPVVHWGSNSLFGDETDQNAFEFYFEKVSTIGVNDLQNKDFDYWPPKWNHCWKSIPSIS